MTEWKVTLHTEDGSEIVPPNCVKCGERKTTYAQGVEAHAWLCGYCDCGWNRLQPAKLMGPLKDGHIRSELGCASGMSIRFLNSDGSETVIDGDKPETFLAYDSPVRDSWVINLKGSDDGTETAPQGPMGPSLA